MNKEQVSFEVKKKKFDVPTFGGMEHQREKLGVKPEMPEVSSP
jgi:hypothetical protein